MNTSEWQRSRLQDLADRETDHNPRCLACDDPGDVHSPDLCAPLCHACAGTFGRWAAANPDAFFEDWPPVNPDAPLDLTGGGVIPAGVNARTAQAEGHASAHGLGVGIVVAVIMTLLAGGFITLLSGEVGSAPHLTAGFGQLAAAMGLLARLVQTGALR
ncbi:hypothetical protein Xcel_0594 [Xylanimonas cellulosilytica DSM 15894]|uniref:Uncharacterized protein n=1 Tax=Xylanimonas cellulosilytica (strain DSM 15894 / JCM 12276 / CECT 5975 / KCTC 9989 / LMG 20990 / NBRC 107835 / XIL07) TaxID=446471 RepID=D1BWQ1_XYLCX|nr:hypothetical protein [Xylanimonas cellulosilytica]ACZ29633.1 hypothetical protein Xcel_0594 [Xylanimonas cellulosilytica DSM 15894]